MAFQDYEESAASGSKVDLITLAMGSTIYRMHNSVELTITEGGDTYHRTHITVGSIATGQEALDVTLSGSHGFSLKFAEIAPGETATLTIRSYHRADPTDVRVTYKGVVRAVAFTSNMVYSKLSLIPVNEAFNKEIPERTFQAPCNNVLFDPDCKISAGSWSYIGVVAAIVDNVVTITGLAASKGSGWSTGGYCSFGVLDYRLILTQSGDDLTLVLPFHESVLGQNITVYAGCDHSIGVCNSKFSNTINFGGCPYVPTKNIFVSGIK